MRFNALTQKSHSLKADCDRAITEGACNSLACARHLQSNVGSKDEIVRRVAGGTYAFVITVNECPGTVCPS